MKTRRGDTENSRTLSTTSRVSAFSHLSVPSITLLTDFGTADYFVPAMKGVILSLNPEARVVDITHEIPPHAIEAGAFILLTAYPTFPAGTIHLAVVDPGVGSSRKPILIGANGHYFVGPDNGLFSYVLDRCAAHEIWHLNNTEFFRQPVSQTFNGRDVFAPVAAALSKGVEPAALGERIGDCVRLQSLRPEVSAGGEVKGRVLHVDRFGNCVTNITSSDLNDAQIQSGATVRINGQVVKSFRNYFAEKGTDNDQIFAIWGSAGFLEVAATNQSAAKLLTVRTGDPVIVLTTIEH